MQFVFRTTTSLEHRITRPADRPLKNPVVFLHGFYEEAGLKVTIIPGGPNAPVLQKVDRKTVTLQ